MFNLETRDYFALLGMAATIGLAIDRWIHRQESDGASLKREFLYLQKTYDDGSARLSKAMSDIMKRIFDIEQDVEAHGKELVRLRTILDHWPSQKTPRKPQ